MTYINNVASPGELARLDHQAGLVGAVTKRLPAALEHADFTTILDIGCGSGRWTLINRSELSKSRNVRVCCAIRDMSL